MEGDFVSPFRIRARMSFLIWFLEVIFACLFLLGEGIMHIVFSIIKIPVFFSFATGVMPIAPGRHRTEAEKDIDRDFVDLVEARGYQVETHFAETSDGYILGVHRILPRTHIDNGKTEEEDGEYPHRHRSNGRHHRSTEGAKSAFHAVPCRGVVFFQHGFMQSSEVFVARADNKCGLPYLLADAGYDVWLGNNRGNKYSHKHKRMSPLKEDFWDFCLDDLAQKDIPAMLSYVLNATGAPNLTYVGFSQGTAQAFAAFSMSAELCSKVNLFVALAPAATVYELHNQLVAAISTSRPQLIYLLFGRRILLSQTLFWRRLLSKQAYVWMIDFMLAFLFGWSTKNINQSEKALLYCHLYSYSSVKCLVHWFQITHSRRFQMYDDNIQVINRSAQYKTYLLPGYDVSQIQCPIAMFHGGKDTVPDMKWLLETVPPKTFVHLEDSYEHLDFLYAKNIYQEIYVKVMELIDQHSQKNK